MPSIFPVLGHTSYAFMQHPTWYMKPCHVLLGSMGVEKIILASTGHFGRKAADELVEYLKRGYSTVVMPDGPWWQFRLFVDQVEKTYALGLYGSLRSGIMQ